MSNLPVVLSRATPAEQMAPDEDPSTPAIGKWYWIAGKTERWLGCVTHMGTNYARLKGIRWARRVHQDVFFGICTFEPNPETVIGGYVEMHQARVSELMNKVRQLTMLLGVGANHLLSTGSETQALTLRRDEPMDSYKTALVKAKDETLPELFKEIKSQHAALAQWMQARLIPMKAQAGALKPAIKAVEDRIFSVQLYAGLTEEIVQIAKGEPASMTAKIHLFQRRAYMDEECLAAYEVGGMEFEDIHDFDKWMKRPANRDRLLPFSRCILSMQVRRHKKERHASTWGEFIQIAKLEEMDRYTYLYMRNGDQLFRLATKIRFEHQLFPDVDEREMLTGKLWARTDSFAASDPTDPNKARRWGDDDEDDDDIMGKHVQMLIPDRQYEEMGEMYRREHAEWRDVKIPEMKRKIAENEKKPKKEQESEWRLRLPDEPTNHQDDYALFDKDNVFYDDIANHIQRQIAAHNRLVLVLQGLLDRSPVMHPHPPWVLWDANSFTQAIEPIYDLGKALVAGEAPDFEAYRARCNSSIKVGTVVLGQERAWRGARREDGEGDDGVSLSYRNKSKRERYRDIKDDGPGKFAHVARIKRGGALVFEWVRTQTFWPRDGSGKKERKFATHMTVKREGMFNVEAYKPGDFKQFLADPRTRENYLKWAPLLLEAEEYHAGNRKVRPREEMPKPRSRTPGGSWEYQERKRKLGYVGMAFELTSDVSLTNGTVYKKGSLWRIRYYERGHFHMRGINKDGTWDKKSDRSYRSPYTHDFRWRPDIPREPKKDAE